MIKRLAIPIIILLLGVFAWAFRYQYVSGPGAIFFRINRWTGTLEICRGPYRGCEKVKKKITETPPGNRQ